MKNLGKKCNMQILLADDHQLVREGLKGVLTALRDKVSFVEADCLKHVFDALDVNDNIDVILFDLKMPDVSGPKDIARIKFKYPEIPLIVISAQQDADIVRQSIDEGADGYISKSSGTGVMLSAINIVLDGEVYFPAIAMNTTGQKLEPNRGILTQRQHDVFNEMQSGLSNKEIAEKLHCSLGTVKSHVSAILKALEVNTRAKAIAKAHEINRL